MRTRDMITKCIRDNDRSIDRSDVVKALIRKPNPKEIKRITELLEDKYGRDVQHHAAWVLERVSARGIDISIAVESLEHLRGIPSVENNAIPALENAIRNEKSRAVAIAALVRALKHDNPEVRAEVARTLGDTADLKEPDGFTEIEVDLSVAEIPLMALLRDPDAKVRIETVGALSNIVKKKKKMSVVIQPFAELLEDPNDKVRSETAWELGRLAEKGADISSAVIPLTRRLGDINARVRTGATWALEKAAEKGIDISVAIETLAGSFTDSDESVRNDAADAFGKAIVNEKTHTVTRSIVIEALKSENPLVRSSAVRALWYPAETGAGISIALKPLTKLLKDPDEKVRLNVVVALEIAVKDNTRVTAIAALAVALEDDSPKILLKSARAFETLFKRGVDISDALPSLTRLLGNLDGEIRTLAIDILVKATEKYDVDLSLVGSSLAEYVARVREQNGSDSDVERKRLEAEKEASRVYSKIASAASKCAKSKIEMDMTGEMLDPRIKPRAPSGWNSGAFRHAAMHGEMARVAMGRMQMQEGRRVALG